MIDVSLVIVNWNCEDSEFADPPFALGKPASSGTQQLPPGVSQEGRSHMERFRWSPIAGSPISRREIAISVQEPPPPASVRISGS